VDGFDHLRAQPFFLGPPAALFEYSLAAFGGSDALLAG
jgi:hypothetical protein